MGYMENYNEQDTAHYTPIDKIDIDRDMQGGMPRELRQQISATFTELCLKTGGKLKDKYGVEHKITPATANVFHAIFLGIHNSQTGQCNPSAEYIAKVAKCKCRETVSRATKILEAIGLIWKRSRYKEVEGQNHPDRLSHEYYIVAGAFKAMKIMLATKDLVSGCITFFNPKRHLLPEKIKARIYRLKNTVQNGVKKTKSAYGFKKLIFKHPTKKEAEQMVAEANSRHEQYAKNHPNATSLTLKKLGIAPKMTHEQELKLWDDYSNNPNSALAWMRKQKVTA